MATVQEIQDTAVDQALHRFLDLVKAGLEKEDDLLRDCPYNKQRTKGLIHERARSIRLAYSELPYAYLIRRSLVLGGFEHRFEFEDQYPDSENRETADLVLLIPDDKGKELKIAVEMKEVHEEKWGAAEDDAKKLARSRFDRGFLLLFPAAKWPKYKSDLRCESLVQPAVHAIDGYLREKKLGEARLFASQSFQTLRNEGTPIDFNLALIEVKPAKR